MQGLSNKQASKLLRKYGKNEIKKKNKKKISKIFLAQFTSPIILILIFASIISLVIGFLPGQSSDIVDTILILIIVLVSGFSGFFQDYKTEKTIEELQKIATPNVRVLREAKEKTISIADIVPGDIVLLNEGDVIPADCKIVESHNLEVDESVLTGESNAIKKGINKQIFKGTFVNSGHAKALVLKTGMKTKLGNIAKEIQKMKKEKSPFEIEISKLSKKILWVITGIIVLIFFISLSKYNLYQSLLVSISLAVAAIPEGLPAVLILVLAIGAKVMAKKHALVRKLNIVESSGAVDIICTDKTGTLTKNEMEVKKIFLGNKNFNVSEIRKKDFSKIKKILTCGRYCNNSKISKQEGKEFYLGDQTEIAIRKVYEKYFKEQPYKRIEEISFTSERKLMSVIETKGDKNFVFSKGATEILIKKCNRILINNSVRKITQKDIKKILQENDSLASHALRVLGFAYKEGKTKILKKDAEKDLIWLGLQGMIDSPKPEVKKALENCRTAGIRVIMLTGDNPMTAKAIAKEVGFSNTEVLTGKDLDKLNDNQLRTKLKSIDIFARISPFHKLKILKILRENSRVAMTGDGVNDALALKKADVGISVGRGTEVAKQSSDIILLNDNFASIVQAVKQGRRAFDNIKKFLNYLFVCNLAEVGVLLFATLFLTLKNPILMPIQILWINLLTDGLPALALGVDPARPNIMNKPPRKKGEPIINKRLAWLIGTIGIKKMIFLFATFLIINSVSGIKQARTALFTGFVLYEFVRIGTIRYQEDLGWFANKWLVYALIGSVILQLLIIYSPLNKYFFIAPLSLFSWIILLSGVTLGYIAAILITKLVIKYIKE